MIASTKEDSCNVTADLDLSTQASHAGKVERLTGVRFLDGRLQAEERSLHKAEGHAGVDHQKRSENNGNIRQHLIKCCL